MCRDERHVFVKNEYSATPGTIMIILNDLKWPIKTFEKKESDTTHNDVQVVSSLSAIQFPPYILFKRRQGIRQFHPKTRDWNSLPNSAIVKQSEEAFKKTVI